MRIGFFAAFVFCVVSSKLLADPEKLRLLNAYREEAGLAAVQYSTVLETAAALHASDMERVGYFSHTGSDGSDVGERVSETGYGWCLVAENIAKGQRDLTEVMEAWYMSPGHRANMLHADIEEFGLAEGEDFIWVMVLSAPGC